MSEQRPIPAPATPRHRAATVLWTLAALALAGAVGAALFVGLGVYDIAANQPHTQPVHSLLETTMHRSVQRRAARLAVPPQLGHPAQLLRGAACFRAHCVQCHGGPGVAQEPIGRSMQPLPGPLVDAAQRWNAAELYWITRNGIRMSGMPAWQFRLGDDELWALVAFMQRLPRLSAAEFAAMTRAGRTAGAPAAPGAWQPVADASGDAAPPCPAPPPPVPAGFVPDPARGRIALTQYACTSCHRIPGVSGSDVHVGPPLAGIARRQLIAGRVPNTPEQMLRWLRDPRSIDPQTTMPALELRERDAHDIAAYLATLD